MIMLNPVSLSTALQEGIDQCCKIDSGFTY